MFSRISANGVTATVSGVSSEKGFSFEREDDPSMGRRTRMVKFIWHSVV